MSQRVSIHDMDAIVLAGGDSTRMGCPKALMPLGNSTLIGTVIGRLRHRFRRVLIVGWDSPNLAEGGVEVVPDAWPLRGPLVGLATGLAYSEAPWCFLVGCDMPFLLWEVISHMAKRLDGCEILVPEVNGTPQPLHAFYGKGCLPQAGKLLEEGTTSLRALLRLCNVRELPADELRDLDPHFLSFRDLDTPEDYQKALRLLKEPR